MRKGMDTKDKIIIILSIIAVILAMISVVLAVPGAISAIDNLLHPQTSIPKINQETSNNNNTKDISSSNVTNSTIGNNNINNNGNDITVGDNNSKTIYINTPNQTPPVTFTPKKLLSYNNSIGMEFVQIPAGSFVMGDDSYYIVNSDTGDKIYPYSPAHTVNIEKDIYIGKYEVTQKQWVDIMGSNTPFKYIGDDYPVYNETLENVQEFISKLNKKEGTDKYRLPSEAEWEYACRAGTTTRYYVGDDSSKLDDYTWYERNSMNEIHPVGQKKPNPWGLYDMLGNVQEMIQDAWHGNYIARGADGDYQYAPSNGSPWMNVDDSYPEFVIRGGGYMDSADYCMSVSRTGCPLGTPDISIGFRLVREV